MAHVGEQAVELLKDLIAIDSINPGLVPGAAGETAIVDFLTTRLQQAGFDVTVVQPEGRPERPSIIAVPSGTSGGPTVVLNGHLDTVGVTGMDAPFTPRIEGNKLYGRGAADMKGGVAGIIAAAEHLVASQAPVRIVLALVADEEDASVGSAAVIDALADLSIDPTMCLIAEPTHLSISKSLRGFGIVKVTFPGIAGHSSQPDLFVNAVTNLGRLLHAVDVRGQELQAVGADLMVTVVNGGISPFVIPDSADCIVEMRTTPQQQGTQALAEVNALLDSEWNATAELVLSRDGWHLQDSGPARDFGHTLASQLGTAIDFAAPYWMEAPMWERVCPTLICGPSGGGLHSIDEWVDLDQVRAFADGLAAVLNNSTEQGSEN